MAKNQESNHTTVARIPVTLNREDNALMIKLRASLESRLNKRMTVADIVRIALRNQAVVEGIISLD